MQMGNQDGSRAGGNRRDDPLGIELPGKRVQIHQHREGTDAQNILEVGLKIVSRQDDLVIGLDSDSSQGQFHGRCPTAAGEDVFPFVILRELSTKFGNVRTMIPPPIPGFDQTLQRKGDPRILLRP